MFFETDIWRHKNAVNQPLPFNFILLYLVNFLLSSCTFISVLLKSFNSLRMYA